MPTDNKRRLVNASPRNIGASKATHKGVENSNANSCEKGMKATRKEFLEFINKPATPGYFSQFFSAIQDAGIVEKNRMGRSFYYTLGPNYEAFTQGTLKRASE